MKTHLDTSTDINTNTEKLTSVARGLSRHFQLALLREAIEFDDQAAFLAIHNSLPEGFYTPQKDDRVKEPLMTYCARHGSVSFFKWCLNELNIPTFANEKQESLLVLLCKDEREYPDALLKASALIVHQGPIDWRAERVCTGFAGSQEIIKQVLSIALPYEIARHGSAEALSLLLNHGLNPLFECQEMDGDTPMPMKYLASEVFRGDGERAGSHTVSQTCVAKIEALFKAGLGPNEKYALASNSSNNMTEISIWEHALNYLPDINFYDKKQNKVLTQLLDLCLESGADTTMVISSPIWYGYQQAEDTRTPLMMLMFKGVEQYKRQILKMIESGADPLQKVYSRKTMKTVWEH